MAARLREIALDRRALRNALDRFDGGQDFASAWDSADPDQINRRDQVERPYERIVNDMQEIIDFCEAEEAERGIPGRRVTTPAAGAAPRCAATSATPRLSDGRASPRAGSALHITTRTCRRRHGLEIFERANELLRELPRAIRGLGRWVEGLWP